MGYLSLLWLLPDMESKMKKLQWHKQLGCCFISDSDTGEMYNVQPVWDVQDRLFSTQPSSTLKVERTPENRSDSHWASMYSGLRPTWRC